MSPSQSTSNAQPATKNPTINGAEFGGPDFQFEVYPDGDVVYQGADNRFVQINFALLQALHSAARKARRADAEAKADAAA